MGTEGRKHPIRLTLFGIEEANRVAQELRPELERLSRLKREHDHAEARVEVLSVVMSGASPENPDARELEVLTRRRDELRSEIGLGIEAIHRRGCLLKDLDKGLVDFYALSGDRLIFLCWQVSEPEVTFWHPLEGGFSGRQPLHKSELD